jgi:hypothetical protein
VPTLQRPGSASLTKISDLVGPLELPPTPRGVAGGLGEVSPFTSARSILDESSSSAAAAAAAASSLLAAQHPLKGGAPAAAQRTTSGRMATLNAASPAEWVEAASSDVALQDESLISSYGRPGDGAPEEDDDEDQPKSEASSMISPAPSATPSVMSTARSLEALSAPVSNSLSLSLSLSLWLGRPDDRTDFSWSDRG